MELLDPRKLWKNQDDYQHYTTMLINAFQDNFKQYDVAEEIAVAGPSLTP